MKQLHPVQDLCTFIDQSPSPWHAVETARLRLEAAGYRPLSEQEPWHFNGGKYYVIRGGSAIGAFRLPARPVTGWKLALAHSDSPTWRLKQLTGRPAAGYTRAPVEGYGGGIHYSWLDRPLTVAGRVILRHEGRIEARLVYLDRDLLIIPSLAIHMQRDLNSGHRFDPAADMQPLYGTEGCEDLRSLIAAELAVLPEDILGADLNLVPRQKAVCLGPAGELLAAPRIDDLECAWATLEGFLSAEGDAAAWFLLDSEEVGSGTRQGALGSFTADVLRRAVLAQGGSEQDVLAAFAGSFAVSADNAHARHPNFPEKSDPVNPVLLNKGPVLKYSANQKYTTDGLTGAVFAELLRRAEVPMQVFTNRPDLPGGSTLGNLLTHSVSVPMVDMGAPQLAMHAAVETAGALDAQAMLRACSAFYQSGLHCGGDGVWYLSEGAPAKDDLSATVVFDLPEAPAGETEGFETHLML